MTLKTTQHIDPRQPEVNSWAELIWAQATIMVPELLVNTAPEVPALFTVGLINGYNRNPGHYDPARNLIVAHMPFTRKLDTEQHWQHLIVHELTHWLQLNLSNYRPTRDTHTHTSWSTACWVVGEAVTGGRLAHEAAYYRPHTSKRDEAGKPTRVAKKAGTALTARELHHFPNCVPAEMWLPKEQPQ